MIKLEFSQSLDDRGWVYTAEVGGEQVAFDLRDHDRVAFLEGILAASGVVESNLRRMDLPDGEEKFFLKGKKVGESIFRKR